MASFSLVLAFAIVGGVLDANSVAQSMLFFAAVTIASGVSYLPRRLAASTPARDPRLADDPSAGAPSAGDLLTDNRQDDLRDETPSEATQ